MEGSSPASTFSPPSCSHIQMGVFRGLLTPAAFRTGELSISGSIPSMQREPPFLLLFPSCRTVVSLDCLWIYFQQLLPPNLSFRRCHRPLSSTFGIRLNHTTPKKGVREDVHIIWRLTAPFSFFFSEFLISRTGC